MTKRKHKCSGCGKWLDSDKLTGTGTDWNKQNGIAEWCPECLKEIKSAKKSKNKSWNKVKMELKL